MTKSNRTRFVFIGILGVQSGLLSAVAVKIGVFPWLIALIVLVALGFLLFTANFSHLFSESASERAGVTLASMIGGLAIIFGLIIGFFG